LQQLVTRSQAQVQAHLDDVRNLLAQGLAVRNDVLKVDVQLTNVGLLKLDADNAVRLARTALNNQIGLSLDTETEPTSEADSVATAPDAGLDSLIAEARQNRPEVRATEHRVRLASAAVTVAEGAWYPQIAFTGNYYYSRPNQRYQPPQDKFNQSWDLGLGASFDVWNWGLAAHQTAEAKAQLAQARAGLEIARNGVALEATQDYQNLLSAAEKVKATGQALGQAEENRQVVEASFKAGSATSSDVLDAETALLQAQVNRTASQVDMELARAKLQKTLGQD
jgi:outer membrane protein TolC